MAFNCTDINTFKADLDNNILVAKNLKKDSHASIKIQSLLNITIYTLATRFLEGSIKLLIFNCAIMRGDSKAQLAKLEIELKKINNPEYTNIRDEFNKHLNFDIIQGMQSSRFTNSDISFLNEIVKNRHRNVHASNDPTEWYNKNLKDISSDFPKEYPGLLNILTYLDCIVYDAGLSTFKD
ncbi:hypothetical protein HDF18_23830 [Mucilaginibacter sp. X5P1]|uniref:hypothetical protein n=1 Tax=Mucilaginibacter sp. X5P1 TaxID=2723088 RepID=UPI00160EE315|nr:hypothetical protein [Mucilaginibacter sp. X5P1]MBB6141244.1 hypothetical protein [Mucilaginibacter sp. X5P1]